MLDGLESASAPELCRTPTRFLHSSHTPHFILRYLPVVGGVERIRLVFPYIQQLHRSRQVVTDNIKEQLGKNVATIMTDLEATSQARARYENGAKERMPESSHHLTAEMIHTAL